MLVDRTYPVGDLPEGRKAIVCGAYRTADDRLWVNATADATTFVNTRLAEVPPGMVLVWWEDGRLVIRKLGALSSEVTVLAGSITEGADRGMVMSAVIVVEQLNRMDQQQMWAHLTAMPIVGAVRNKHGNLVRRKGIPIRQALRFAGDAHEPHVPNLHGVLLVDAPEALRAFRERHGLIAPAVGRAFLLVNEALRYGSVLFALRRATLQMTPDKSSGGRVLVVEVTETGVCTVSEPRGRMPILDLAIQPIPEKWVRNGASVAGQSVHGRGIAE